MSGSVDLIVDGQVVTLAIPAPSDRPSAFAFSLHKAGSVLLTRVIQDLAKASRTPFFNAPDQAFQYGLIEDRFSEDTLGTVFAQDGYIFTGFRGINPALTPDVLSGRRKVLLVRDPRDMVVSLYFSVSSSHPLPKKGSGRELLLQQRERAKTLNVNAYALEKIGRLAGNYRKYMALIDGTWRVYRYEDIIFRKREWVIDLADYLDLSVRRATAVGIADANDVSPPKAERPEAHIRQVQPGNHLKHLKPETIEQLNLQLHDILQAFGYDSSFAPRSDRQMPTLNWPIHFIR